MSDILAQRVAELTQVVEDFKNKSKKINQLDNNVGYEDGMLVAVFSPSLGKAVQYPLPYYELGSYINRSEINIADGVAGLDENELIYEHIIPNIPITKIIELQTKLSELISFTDEQTLTEAQKQLVREKIGVINGLITDLTSSDNSIKIEGTSIRSNISDYIQEEIWNTGESSIFSFHFNPTNLLHVFHKTGGATKRLDSSQFTVQLPSDIQINETLNDEDIIIFHYQYFTDTPTNLQ